MDPLEILPADLESLLAFWAEAGVDYALEAEAQDRLAPRAPRRRAPAPETAAESARRASTPPGTAPPAPSPIDLAAQSARELAAGARSLGELDAARTQFLSARAAGGTAPDPSALAWRRGEPGAPLAVIADFGGAAEGGVLSPEEDRLFEAMASAAGLDGKMMLCALAPASLGGRGADGETLGLFRPFVLRLLEVGPPRLVLVLGAGAAAALGPSLAADEASPRAFAALDLPSGAAPTLVTLHPRFLLRQPLGKKRAWADLLRLKARLRDLEGAD